jgi:RNA polymerase sigma factor (sigma-70 family)
MTPTPTDAARLTAVATLARGGDRSAISTLSVLATTAARAMAAPLVEGSAVDDVAQEAVLEMLATLHRLRHDEAFVAWFRLIVRKQADRHRRRHRPTADLGAIAETTSYAAGPAALAERHEQAQLVRAAMIATPEADRVILAHKYFDDWSDQQLADLLSISTGAVRKRLFDARRRLRPILAALLDISPTSLQRETTVNLDTLFGTVISPDDVPPLDEPLPLVRPEAHLPLVTGFPMIDLVAPLPRGGVAEFRPGNILFLSELICNLASAGPAALVAVGARRPSPDGIYSRFHRLVSPERTAALTITVDCRDGRDERAVDAGGRLAATIANDGTDVLLVLDEVISATVDESVLRRHVGIRNGAVTGLRTGRLLNAAVPPLWAGADAVVVVASTDPLNNATLDVNPTVSWSKVLDNPQLPSDHAEAARALRDLFDRASRARKALQHTFDIADGWTGHSSGYVGPELAAARVRELING